MTTGPTGLQALHLPRSLAQVGRQIFSFSLDFLILFLGVGEWDPLPPPQTIRNLVKTIKKIYKQFANTYREEKQIDMN